MSHPHTEGPKCDTRSGAICESRRDAQRSGEMFYSTRHHGYVFPADGRAVPRLLRAKLQAPFVWHFCAFCGGDLPVHDTPPKPFYPPPTWTGEDGG